jgi:hypothetical protein
MADYGQPGGGVGGQDPGDIRVLLNNPRWERRLLWFLELSGAGRVVEDGTDEEEARAARLDGWVVWEAEERSRSSAHSDTSFFLLFYTLFRGTHTPSSAHSA